MSGPEKPKIIGEEWSDERVRGFLDLKPYREDLDADYFVLLRAYESMRAEDFERFIKFFVESGRNLNAVNELGESILDRVSEHRRSVDYARILERAGAKKSAGAGA